MSLSNNTKLNKLAATSSITVACVLSLIKIGASLATGSLAIISSAIDSVSDIIASLITRIAVHFSGKPLTHTHRYGYGKIESVSALLQSFFIFGSALYIFGDAIRRCFIPTEIKQTTAGIIIMIISLILTIALIILQKYVIRKTNSQAIAADSVHYVVDILSNLAVLLSLFLSKYFHIFWSDIFIACIISAYLCGCSFNIAKRALNEITDCEVDEEIRNHIISILQAAKNIEGYHDLRTRLSGDRMFIEVHLEFNGDLPLWQTHQYSEKLEKDIVAFYPNAQIIVHQDPWGIDENRLDSEINKI